MMSDSTDQQKIHVLIVDDDRNHCMLIEAYLVEMGYQVSCAHKGLEGLKKAKSGDHHIIVLDVQLPEMDGFQILSNLRKESDTPVIMLTSRQEEADRIVGLEIGADDYLPKPFSMRELLARIRAITRRSYGSKPKKEPEFEEPMMFGDLRIEPASRTAFLKDQPLDISPVEFDVLLTLAKSKDRVLSRDYLLDEIRGRDYEVFDRSVDMHISSIRKKLGDDPKNPSFIKTVRSAGYMFIGKKD